MTTVLDRGVLEFALDPRHQAHEPPEERGLRRDRVRLMVSRGDANPIDSRFDQIGAFLAPGDLLVVNTSATIPAALDGRFGDDGPVVVHLSGTLPGDLWLVEPRAPSGGSTLPLPLGEPRDVHLDGGVIRLLAPFKESKRLWLATSDVDLPSYARENGSPIRYRYVPRPWPLDAYQTVFAREPGSAEMPSASRPFSHEVVSDLAARGVLIVPLLLHTGVSSLEGGEQPYPEYFRVPGPTAAIINAVRKRGGRVIAAGTTVVRALASVADGDVVSAGEGWTEVVVSREHPVGMIDGLLTGWHEPESSHLMMLEAFASPDVLARAYGAALERGYLWHEFGDSHLILRAGGPR